MPKRTVLTEAFFARDTKAVAKDLLGKVLVRKIGRKEISGLIVETEAYDGFQDQASHAFRGRTPRTEVMFGKPGHWYVYFTYGMHHMLNVVTREAGHPAGVLIRAVRMDGVVINGPGKLTKFFQIDKSLNARRAEKKSGLWIEDREVAVPGKKILKTPRIGIAYAGPVWAAKKWRFILLA